MGIVWVAVLIIGLVRAVLGAPAIKFDQRQEGDVNIRADLENFVILLIPTSATGGSLGLLELLSKTLPGKTLNKHSTKKQHNAANQQTQPQQHFIESKTAPYHVDISRTRSQLAKLHPQPNNDEVLIAHSPTISLLKTDANSVSKEELETDVEPSAADRFERNIRLNSDVNDFPAFVLSPGLKLARAEKKGAENNKEMNRTGENLTLLGAELDQCAPDQKRDVHGICQIVQ